MDRCPWRCFVRNRIEPGPGQESVWDYPRPPRCEPTTKLIQVRFGSRLIAESRSCVRVLETSHPPVFYIPPTDIAMELIEPNDKRSFCEWKGTALYWDVALDDRHAAAVAWSYPDPVAAFEPLRDFLAFYPSRMDACFVDGEPVQAQQGDFYGGWITREIVGPFKGAAGTWGW
ncbi:MAG: DUF427 domain-containing protein [Acidobacteriota bacterium]